MSSWTNVGAGAVAIGAGLGVSLYNSTFGSQGIY